MHMYVEHYINYLQCNRNLPNGILLIYVYVVYISDLKKVRYGYIPIVMDYIGSGCRKKFIY